MRALLKYNLDVSRTGRQVKVDAYQGDTASRTVLFTLSCGAQPFDLSDAVIAVMYADKPDGTRVMNQCEITDDGITMTITSQCTAVPGLVNCQLVLQSDTELIASPEFVIDVRERASFPIYEVQTAKPEDWAENYRSYYAKDENGFLHNVSSLLLHAWITTSTDGPAYVYTEKAEPMVDDALYIQSGDTVAAFTIWDDGQIVDTSSVNQTITLGVSDVSSGLLLNVVYSKAALFEISTDIPPEWEAGKYYTLQNGYIESENEYGALINALVKADQAFENSVKSIVLTEDKLEITYQNGNIYLSDSLKGPKGEQGKDGESAYEIAVGQGFQGTEAEWLESLGGGGGLPEVTSADNGKLLKVVNGSWQPAVSSIAYYTASNAAGGTTIYIGNEE